MAQRGKPSIAHKYDERGVCVHCDMYKVNVERMSHVCRAWRELEVDQEKAKEAKMTLEEYRLGDQRG